MSFSDILEILKYSIDFEEFQINYNDLIPEIVKAKNNSLSEWKVFIKEKNELKKILYEKYCIEFPTEHSRLLRNSKYIDENDISNEITEVEKIINQILNFKNRLEKLK